MTQEITYQHFKIIIMSYKILELKRCEYKGNDFEGRVLNFPNRDISLDTFEMIVKTQWKAKTNSNFGKIESNSVYFDYSNLKNFQIGAYTIEYFANFNLIGRRLIAIEYLTITDRPCYSGVLSEINFDLIFTTDVINFELSAAIVNIGEVDPGVMYNDLFNI